MSDDRLLAALRPVVAVFGRLGISYQIGGSVASSTFGHARSTLDIDLVADVRLEHAEPIAAALRGDYYADADLIRDAVRHRPCFNLIYLLAYFKVDVFVPKDSTYEQQAFARSVTAELRAGGDSGMFSFATAEDVCPAQAAMVHRRWWQRPTMGGHLRATARTAQSPRPGLPAALGRRTPGARPAREGPLGHRQGLSLVRRAPLRATCRPRVMW